MEKMITREEALALLRRYNKEPFHLQHALTVEAVMRWFANELGYGEEADFWAMCGLLHDIDFENWPQEHCKKAPELLRPAGVGEAMIHAICSHGHKICTEVTPEHQMEKVLFACDELTGLIGAAALMRPSRSCTDMELSSVKKKFKDKKFAAGCSRDVIRDGAALLGWELDGLLQKTLTAMQQSEAAAQQELAALLGEVPCRPTAKRKHPPRKSSPGGCDILLLITLLWPARRSPPPRQRIYYRPNHRWF